MIYTQYNTVNYCFTIPTPNSRLCHSKGLVLQWAWYGQNSGSHCNSHGSATVTLSQCQWLRLVVPVQQPLALLAHHDSSLIHSSCRAPGSRAAATSQTLHLSSGLGFGLGPKPNAALPGPPAPTNGGGHCGVAGSASLRRATGSLSSWSDSKLLLHPNWRATISNIPVRTRSQDWVRTRSQDSESGLSHCVLSRVAAT